jgi:hypothetical protein
MAGGGACDSSVANVTVRSENQSSQKVGMALAALRYDGNVYPVGINTPPFDVINAGRSREYAVTISPSQWGRVLPQSIRHLVLLVDYGWVETRKARVWMVRDTGFVTGRNLAATPPVSTGFQCTLSATLPRDRPDVFGDWRISAFTDSRGSKNIVYLENLPYAISTSAAHAAIKQHSPEMTHYNAEAGLVVPMFSIATQESDSSSDPQLSMTFVGGTPEEEEAPSGGYTYSGGGRGSAYTTDSYRETQIEPFAVPTELIVSDTSDILAGREIAGGQGYQYIPLEQPEVDMSVSPETTFASGEPVFAEVIDTVTAGRYGQLMLVEDRDLSIRALVIELLGMPLPLYGELNSSSIADLFVRSQVALDNMGVSLQPPYFVVGPRCYAIVPPTMDTFNGFFPAPFEPGEFEVMTFLLAHALTADYSSVEGYEGMSPAGSDERLAEFTASLVADGIRVDMCDTVASQSKKGGLSAGTVAIGAIGAFLLLRGMKKD